MNVTHPNYPCVNETIKQVNMITFRGSVVGQHNLDMPVNKHDSVEIEIAKNFDVTTRLKNAKKDIA